jgi:hypothetical protein
MQLSIGPSNPRITDYRADRFSALSHINAQNGRSAIPDILANSPDKASFFARLKKHLSGLSTLEEDYESSRAYHDALKELIAGDNLKRIIR